MVLAEADRTLELGPASRWPLRRHPLGDGRESDPPFLKGARGILIYTFSFQKKEKLKTHLCKSFLESGDIFQPVDQKDLHHLLLDPAD